LNKAKIIKEKYFIMILYAKRCTLYATYLLTINLIGESANWRIS